MFAPSSEAVNAVRDWLVQSGVEARRIRQSTNKGWLALEIPAWQAEDLFLTEYYEHVNDKAGRVKIGSDEYALT